MKNIFPILLCLMLVTSQVYAVVQTGTWVEGDAGDATPWTSVTIDAPCTDPPNWADTSPTPKNGSYSIKVTCIGDNGGLALETPAPASGETNPIEISFWIYWNTVTGNGNMFKFRDGSGNTLGFFGKDTSEQYFMYHSSVNATRTTTNNTISTGQWDFIEIENYTHNTDGYFRLWVNGIFSTWDMSVEGFDTQATAADNGTLRMGLSYIPTGDMDYNFDEIVIGQRKDDMMF